MNLYGFCGNDGINRIDYYGLDPITMEPFVVTGAKVGSTFGPAGAAIGAVIGAAVSVLSDIGLGNFFSSLFGLGHSAAAKPVNPQLKYKPTSSVRHFGDIPSNPGWQFNDYPLSNQMMGPVYEGGSLPRFVVEVPRLTIGETVSAFASGAAQGFVGFWAGAGKSAWGMVSGTANMVLHPIQTGEGIGSLVWNAYNDPAAMASALKAELIRATTTSEGIGGLTFQVALFAGTVGKLGMLGKGGTAETTVARQTTILGENMGQRVMPFAERTGARNLGFGASREEWASMSFKQRWKLNDGMLRARINEGDAFRYIGQDPLRNPALRIEFDLTRSELLRLESRAIPYETVSPSEVISVLGHP